MSKSYSLDKRLRILSPCGESWETMAGNDQVRFCSHCQKNVHNITSLNREQASELAFKSEGRLCVKYYKKSDGTIKFVPSVPNTEAKVEQSPLMKFAAGLFFAAALTSQSPVMAQNVDLEANLAIAALQESGQQTAPIPQKTVLLEGPISIKGIVQDEAGGVIAGANLILTGKSTGVERTIISNEKGDFLFESLPEDDYILLAETNGFKKVENEIPFLSNAKGILSESITIDVTITMQVAYGEGMMGLVAMLSPGEEMISYYEERDRIRKSEKEKPETDEEINPLFSVVERGEIKEIKAILKNGAQLNITNEEGETLLSYASGNEKMLKLLLKAGAEVNLTNRFSTTTLMYAAVRENTKIVNLLISYGANLNAVDINGRSALIFAAADDNLEMVKLLLAAGANPNIRDSQGKTALSYASEYKFKEIKRLLKSIGAQK